MLRAPASGLSAGSLREPPRRISRNMPAPCRGAAHDMGRRGKHLADAGDAPCSGRAAPVRSAPFRHPARAPTGSGSPGEPEPVANSVTPAPCAKGKGTPPRTMGGRQSVPPKKPRAGAFQNAQCVSVPFLSPWPAVPPALQKCLRFVPRDESRRLSLYHPSPSTGAPDNGGAGRRSLRRRTKRPSACGSGGNFSGS